MATQLIHDGPDLARPTVHTAYIASAAPRQAAARVLLVATLLAAPLAFGAVQEWAWATMSVLAFTLFFLWSLSAVRQGRLKLYWSPLYLPAGLFFLLAEIQSAAHLTLDPSATREALLKLATSLVLFFVAGQFWAGSRQNVPPRFPARVPPDPTSRTHSAYRSRTAPLRWTIILYTFLLSLFAILQFFSSGGLIYWRLRNSGWAFGSYVNHNHYAGLMEMLIPLAVASALPTLRKHPAAAAALGCLVLIPVASLLLSGSRGGFIAMMTEALLAAVLILWRGPRQERQFTASLGTATILAATLLFFWMAPRPIADRLTTFGDRTHPRDVELGYRLAVSRDSLQIFRNHLWLGTGLGSFETTYPRYQSFPTELIWDHAHNDYVEVLAETGLAGGALIASALATFFWMAFGNLGARLQHSFGWLPFAASLACCGLLIHSFADFNFHIPANAAWFGVCAAIASM